MNKYFIIVFSTFLLLQIPLKLLGQETKLVGVLKDTINQSIEGAIIQVIDSKNHILSYTISSKDGKYQINIPNSESQLQLVIQAFGYETEIYPLTNQLIQKGLFDLELKIKELSLETIIIKGDPINVVERGDTTHFNAQRFADSTERNIEDLLKKIPGVRIDNQGKIFYKNRQVEDVLLDGDNLYGSNYTLLTRNLQAQVIENIDFIDNYNEDKELNGVYKSNRLALNLGITENIKKKNSGSLNIDCGNNQRREVGLHFLSLLNKKHKIYGFVKHSNLGQILFEKEEFKQNTNTSLSSISLNNPQSFIFFKSGKLKRYQLSSPTFLPPEAIRFNEPLLSSISYVGKFKGDTKLILTGLYSQDKLQQSYKQETNYILQDSDNLFTRESQNISNKDAVAGLRAIFSTAIGTKSTLHYQGIFQGNVRNSTRFNNFIGQELLSPTIRDTISELQEQKIIDTQHLLRFNHRFNERLALIVQANYQTYNREEQSNMEGLTNRYTTFLSRTDTLLSVFPQLSSQLSEAGFLLSIFDKNKKGFESNCTIGIHYLKEISIDSTYFKEEFSQNNINPIIFQANNTFNNTKPYLQYILQKKIGLWSWKAAVKTSLENLSIQKSDTIEDKTFFLFSAGLQLNYQKGMHQFSLLYEYYANNPLSLDLLRNNYILIDYRNVSRGTSQLGMIGTHRLDLVYTRINPVYNSIFSSILHYATNDKTYSSLYIFDPLLSINQTNLLGKSQEFLAFISIEKYVPLLRIKLKFENDIIWQQTPSELAIIGFRQNDVLSYTGSLKTATSLSLPVNFVTGANLIYNNIFVKSLDIDEQQRFVNTFFKFEFSMYLKALKRSSIFKNLYLKINTDLIIIEQNSYLYFNAILFQDIQLNKKLRLPIRVTFYNLTNQKSFEQISLSSILNSIDSYTLIPFYILVGTSFNF